MRHRTFDNFSNPPLDGLNYAADKPFSAWQSKHLETLISGWLQLDPPCLELATLALAELTTRRDDLAARMKFANADLEPVSWLADARQAVRQTFKDEFENEHSVRKGRGRVYVILRGGYTETNGWYGAYVGSTTKSVGARFKEHRTGGPRSARGLPTHGIEPLYSLFMPLNPVASSRNLLREWETRLHECLAPVVPKVTGDVAF